MKPRVIFEDEELLVLDKPAGMIVNKSDTTKSVTTLQDWVESYFGGVMPNSFRHLPKKEILKPVQDDNNENNYKEQARLDFVSRAGIVHRLDKETSGIILVAKTADSFVNLQSQFKERRVQKTYIALAHGKIEPEVGTIDVEVGRLPWNRKRFGVLSGGRGAVTMYKVLSIKYLVSGKEKEPLTLVELSPKTGRTHQIRVHLQYIKHPIFADPLYAGRKTSRNDRQLLSRIFLHAAKISFSHPARIATQSVAGGPKTGAQLSFESPLPEELKDFISKLS
jgi:23S rRNA pseudouridine1911/1915/1917 synthase